MGENDLFRVDSIDEITFEYFKTACIACMSEEEELAGLLGVPCGSDFILYEGKGKAHIHVRNWSHMLSLHVVSESGTWLVSSHFDGMGVDGTIEAAWTMFNIAKPLIRKKTERAFKEVELSEGTRGRWLESCSEYYKKIEAIVKKGVDK